MSTSNFNFIFLGQSVLRYKTPAVVQHAINSIYETKINNLPPANIQLIGKINKEHSLALLEKFNFPFKTERSN